MLKWKPVDLKARSNLLPNFSFSNNTSPVSFSPLSWFHQIKFPHISPYQFIHLALITTFIPWTPTFSFPPITAIDISTNITSKLRIKRWASPSTSRSTTLRGCLSKFSLLKNDSAKASKSWAMKNSHGLMVVADDGMMMVGWWWLLFIVFGWSVSVEGNWNNKEDKKLEKGTKRKPKWCVRRICKEFCVKYQNDVTMRAHELAEQLLHTLEVFTWPCIYQVTIPTVLVGLLMKETHDHNNSLGTETSLRASSNASSFCVNVHHVLATFKLPRGLCLFLGRCFSP